MNDQAIQRPLPAQANTVHLSRDANASIALFLGGCLWGTFWFPIRRVEESGVVDGWASVALFVPLTLLLLPFALANRSRLFAQRRTLIPAGALIGLGFALYSTGLLLTDVLRVILLFYLLPVWGTLLSWIVQRQRVSVIRLVALVLGLAGLITILGTEGGFPLPRNMGDWMALLAGFVWAVGSLVLHTGEEQHPLDIMFAFAVAGTLAAVGLLLIPLDGHQQPPSLSALQEGWVWILVMVVFFTIPVMWTILWASTFLDPGRVGLLLLSEVVVGVTTAALWAGETFGTRETVGAALIAGAGLVDVLGQRKAGTTPG